MYCPGNGQELLSALGVILVCHASNVFLVLKVLLSIIDAFSKSMAWLLDHAWLAILEPLAAVLVFLKCSFFLVFESSAGFPNITPWTCWPCRMPVLSHLSSCTNLILTSLLLLALSLRLMKRYIFDEKGMFSRIRLLTNFFSFLFLCQSFQARLFYRYSVALTIESLIFL